MSALGRALRRRRRARSGRLRHTPQSAATHPAALHPRAQALAVSLLLFRQRHPGGLLRAASGALGLSRPSSAAGVAAQAPAGKPRAGFAARMREWVGLNLPVILMYCPVHLFFTRGCFLPMCL